MHTDRLPRIAITVGDPSGIGPEIAVKASSDPRVREVAEIVVYGPSTDDALKAFKTGEVTAESGRVAYETILQAVEDVQAERLDALVELALPVVIGGKRRKDRRIGRLHLASSDQRGLGSLVLAAVLVDPSQSEIVQWFCGVHLDQLLYDWL